MNLQHFELKLDHIPTDAENDKITEVFGSSAISGNDLNQVGSICVSVDKPTYEGARLRAVLDANKAGLRVTGIEDALEEEYNEHFAILERALADTYDREQLRVRLQILVWHHVRKTEQLRAEVKKLEKKLTDQNFNELLEDRF